jgi:hypothetical protein
MERKSRITGPRIISKKSADMLDRFAQFALIRAGGGCGCRAEITPALGERMAIVTGTSSAGQTSEDLEFHSL